MTHNLCNYTAYIASDNTGLLIDSIVQLCEKEGMRRVAEPLGKVNYPALKSNNWRIDVIQGTSGWHVLDTEPWDLLSDRAHGSDRSRLFDLCESLRTAGFALHISDGGPWGEILMEADGHGRQNISGYWYEEGDEADMYYFGIPLSANKDDVDGEDCGYD